MWHDRRYSFLWVPVKGSLCLFWRKTRTKGLRARFPMRPEEDEGKQGHQTKESIEKIEQGSRQNRAVTRACGPRGRVGQRERNFARIIFCGSPQMHRKLRKSIKTFSLLTLGANPSPCLFVLFSSTLPVAYVVFRVSIKNVKYPWQEMRETTRWSDGLGGWDSRGRPAMHCHNYN